MLAPFLIMLREGLEAALIVGIIASYLRQTGRTQWLPAVWVGVLLAIALSLFAGAAVLLAGREFPQQMQELFEAIVGLVAVVVLSWMVFWMRGAARSIKAQLYDSMDAAFAHESRTGTGATWALVGMAFFAVAREGLESVFFLLAIFQQSSSSAVPLGALAGVGVAVLLGIGIYYGGIRLDLRRFFRWTGIFILFVAAGLLASVLRNLHEAGIWNLLQTRVFDWSEVLPNASVAGTVLSGLLGYHESPTRGELLAWLLYLVPALVLFLRPHASAAPAPQQQPQSAGASADAQ
ncbi:iron transporter [Corticibacter populi]|uniref:Iron transporter n=1 Tax=Corticibacter populi TaxID=1550736 RepID=A0A3M6QUA1_9BURK|nr:iron uptake transporter permease EfeU [Corticibacter populi]RMX06543.1 iron transporter [Corticibacter populi]RZS31893.1 high-affinity iron transporter [Corticibacter populi]